MKQPDQKGTYGVRILRNTLLNFSGTFVPLVFGVLSIPFAIKGLGKDAFGILSITWVILGYFGLFDFGLSKAATKYTSECLENKNRQKLSAVVWTALIVSFFFGIIGSGLLFLITPVLTRSWLNISPELRDPAANSFFIIACVLPAVLCSTGLRGILGAARRFDLVNMVLIPAGMLTFIIPGLALPFHWTLEIVVFLIALTRLFAGITFFFMTLRVLPEVGCRPVFQTNLLKKMLKYGGWVSVSNVISPLLVYLDRLVIGAMLSMASVTYYSAPNEIIVRLRIIPNAILTTLFPEFSRISAENFTEDIDVLIARAVKWIFVMVGVFVVLFSVHAPTILEIWLGSDFIEASTNVIRILAVGILINAAATIPFGLLQGMERPDLPARFHMIEFPVYMILLVGLTGIMGIDGAALAWTIRVIIDGILLFRAVEGIKPGIIRKIGISLKGSVIWLFLFLAVLIFSSHVSTSMIETIFVSFVVSISFAAIFYFFLEEEEKKFLKRGVKKIAG